MPNQPVETAQVSLRTVLLSMVGLWLCYFLLATLRGALIGLELQGELLWRRGLVSGVGVLVTIALWLILRLADNRRLALKVTLALLVSMPGAVLIAQFNQWIFKPLEAKVEQDLGAQRGVALRRDEAGNLLVDLPQAAITPPADAGAASAPGTPRSVIVAPAPTSAERWTVVFDIALGRYFVLLAWAALYFASGPST